MRATVVLVVAVVVLAGCVGSGPAASPSATPTDSMPDVAGGERAVDEQNTLEVHFIDLGQSSSTLVVGPTGETLLVDTGDYPDDGEYVLQYLRRHDIDRIDYLVTSHADADHIGGHAAVIEYMETQGRGVGAIYDPGIAASTRTYEEYLDAVETYEIPLYRTRTGDRIPFAGVSTRVLAPPADPLAGGERNENSIALRLAYGNASFLLTGDAENAGEEYLVERYGDRLGSTVLAAGHHGSRSSTSDSLLDTVSPRFVAISSAYDSRYGHPHDETLRRLSERPLPTYWTATHGDVVFVTNGRSLTVETQRRAPTDPLRLRDGRPTEPELTDSVAPRRTIALSNVPGESGTGGRAAVANAPAGAESGSGLEIAAIHADADGDDGTNLNDEYVVLANSANRSIDLSGWVVEDGSGRTYEFSAGTILAPGERLTLRTGSGANTGTDHYWGSGSPVWNNDGDTITVVTENGSRVLTEAYAG